jgi:hypothetical protein
MTLHNSHVMLYFRLKHCMAEDRRAWVIMATYASRYNKELEFMRCLSDQQGRVLPR